MIHSIDSIRTLFRQSNHPISDMQGKLLTNYVQLLLDWNQKVNLISRKDTEHVWRNHILHSLGIVFHEKLPEHGHFLDVGTGGGLPGVPLAIMFPHAQFVLCDSIAKKITAVTSMIESLALPNVTCRTMRAEDLSKVTDIISNVDVICARAVTHLKDLVKWSAPLAKRNGSSCLLAWKGGDVTDECREVAAVKMVKELRIYPLTIPGEAYFEQEQKLIVRARFHAS